MTKTNLNNGKDKKTTSGDNKPHGNQKHHYCDRVELHKELIYLKATGKHSDALIEMFQAIINGYHNSLYKADDPHKKDKSQYAMLQLILYAHNYEPERQSAFAYVTQIVKNGFRYYYSRWVARYDKEIQVEFYGRNLE